MGTAPRSTRGGGPFEVVAPEVVVPGSDPIGLITCGSADHLRSADHLWFG
ncbi:hypothetical protein [Parasphingorhabdus pacifica]